MTQATQQEKELFANDAGKDSGFGRFARHIAQLTGSSYAFGLAIGTIILWLISGPVFGFSDTWQLIINTSTTIVTFLMVFIIQHTQNKDTLAMQLKMNELIRATEGAHNATLDLEDLSEKELEAIHKRYCELAKEARRHLRHGMRDTNKPRVKEDFDLAPDKPKPSKRARLKAKLTGKKKTA
jgi:low affinity Fe/Cu permease